MSIILPFDQWSLVAPIVTGEFGNTMPTNPNRATFVSRLNAQNDLKGFVQVEVLYHFSCEWLAPKLRGNSKEAVSLMADAVTCIPVGFSGIWLSDRRTDRIARMMGARYLGDFSVYRKDV